MDTFQFFPGDEDCDAIEAALRDSGVQFKHQHLIQAHEPATITDVLFITAATLQAAAVVIVGYAKHKKRAILVKQGDKTFYAQNYSADELAKCFQSSVTVVMKADGDKKPNNSIQRTEASGDAQG